LLYISIEAVEKLDKILPRRPRSRKNDVMMSSGRI